MDNIARGVFVTVQVAVVFCKLCQQLRGVQCSHLDAVVDVAWLIGVFQQLGGEGIEGLFRVWKEGRRGEAHGVVPDVGVQVYQLFSFPNRGHKHACHGFLAVGAAGRNRAENVLAFLQTEQMAFAAQAVHEEVSDAVFYLEIDNRGQSLMVNAAVIVKRGNQFCYKVLKKM